MPDLSKTILCVDDEPIILKSLSRLLTSAGYNVLVVEDGTKALEVMASHKVDLVIADQRMPFMTGAEFFHLAQQQQPGITGIMLSGYSDLDSLAESIRKGEILCLLDKPWDSEGLLNTIAGVFDKSRLPPGTNRSPIASSGKWGIC